MAEHCCLSCAFLLLLKKKSKQPRSGRAALLFRQRLKTSFIDWPRHFYGYDSRDARFSKVFEYLCNLNTRMKGRRREPFPWAAPTGRVPIGREKAPRRDSQVSFLFFFRRAGSNEKFDHTFLRSTPSIQLSWFFTINKIQFEIVFVINYR